MHMLLFLKLNLITLHFIVFGKNISFDIKTINIILVITISIIVSF